MSTSSDTPSRREWLVRAAAAVSSLAAAHAAPLPETPADAPACPAGVGTPQSGGALPEIGEIVSGQDRVLRATVTVEDEVRAVWTAMPNTVDDQQFNKSTCREGYPMRYFAGANTGGKRVWPAVKGVPGPGPTLRARVGDTVQIVLLNHVDVKNFPNTLDLAEQGKSAGCDSSTTLVGDPGQESRQQIYPAGDEEPDCFHGSSSANLHFHGFHISPSTISDNVLVQVRPSPRDPRTNQPLVTETTVRKPFQDIFDAAGRGHGPTKWDDLPQEWRDAQAQLLKAYDAQVPAAKLWAADQAAIAAGEWPQYYVGAYPNCFRITAEQMPLGHDGVPAKMGQSPGTHWYHAHKHGSTALNSFNGMSGAFIVEGDYDDRLRAFYRRQGLEEKVMVLQQLGPALNLLTTPAPNASGQSTHANPLVFVNGMLQPTVTMRPGQVQLWRLLNACGQTAVQFAEIEAVPAGDSAGAPRLPFAWKQTAQDGIQYHWNNFAEAANRNPKITLNAANRADILVQAPATPGLYRVKTNLVPGPGPNARLVLMTIRVEGEPIVPAMGFPATAADFPPFPESLADIDPASIHLHRELIFDTASFRGNGQRADGAGRGPFPGSRPSRHTIDGAQFQNNLINQTMVLDTAEEWTLTNTTRILQPPGPPPPPDAPPAAIEPFLPFAHPFHIHINPFQVIEIFDPVNMDEPLTFEKDVVWYDIIGIPPAYNYHPNGTPRTD
jgi:FtsP/CotA-like multicopper oxidase with cupredoxin domain